MNPVVKICKGGVIHKIELIAFQLLHYTKHQADACSGPTSKQHIFHHISVGRTVLAYSTVILGSLF